jgi:putative transposase
MYNWRKMSKEQREDLLKTRKSQEVPWHSPPHVQGDKTRFHVTAACYEHKNIIGLSTERISDFEDGLLQILRVNSIELHAWVVLPNHYHVLLMATDILSLLKKIVQLHGRSSFYWNGEEGLRGRRVWCNALETGIKSERHFWATVNYIHHNPVKHGHVDKWTEWPYSSAATYLKSVGREQALKNWKEYDISEMGRDWDEF